jgi:hypothetical protein
MAVTLSRDQARAADILEAMYAAAIKLKEERNPVLFDPHANPTLRRVVLDEAYPMELGEGHWDAWTYDRAYANSTEILAPRIRDAAQQWTLETLESQAKIVGQVKLFVGQYSNLLHNAAQEVHANLRRVEGQELTSSQMKAITGESGNKEGKTVQERLNRVTYMRTVLDLGGKSSEESKLPMRRLYRLMVHPKGVGLVDEFAASTEDGRDYAMEVIEESEDAMQSLRGNLLDDESLVWRYPPALTAGVSRIGLGPRPGLTAFALAWARWGEPATANRALDIAGNALMALQLVGGPLAAPLGEALDFMLGVIGTAVQFVRDLEQDQAGMASAFGDDGERLSEGSSYTATALMGATTLLSVILPLVLRRIASRAGVGATQLLVTVEKRAAAVEVQDARQLARRGLQESEATSRLAETARLTGNKGTITTAKTIEAEALVKREAAVEERESAQLTGSSTGSDTQATATKGTGNNGTGNNGTGNNGAGGGPPPPPPGQPRLGRANTRNPGVDVRTAGGGITFVHEEITPLNQRRVEIVGRIELINGTTPASIFVHEHPTGAALGLPGYDRCHLFPLQWGDEAAAGFMYADGNTFNNSFQKRLENYVRKLRDDLPARAQLNVRVTAFSAERTTAGGNLLEQLKYDFWAEGSSKHTIIEFNVEPPPGGRILPAANFAW